MDFPDNFPNPIIPETESGSFKESYADSTISSSTDAGYKITRARTTRLLGSWTYHYRGVSNEQYAALSDFWRNQSRGTANSFGFVIPYGPRKNEKVTVRFTEMGDWLPYYEGYRGSFTVEEV